MRERLVGRYERFRQRVVESTCRCARPTGRTTRTSTSNATSTTCALPAPGGDAELQELVGDLMATPLDRSKPLWDLYLVDGYRGGSALVSRMHHCIADGIALARVMLSLADEQRRRRHRARTARARAARRGCAARARASGAGGGRARRRTPRGALGHEGIELVTRPRSELAHLAGEAARDARALRKLLLTRADAKTVFKGRMGVPRRAAWSRSSTSTRSRRSGTRAGRPSTTCSSRR